MILSADLLRLAILTELSRLVNFILDNAGLKTTAYRITTVINVECNKTQDVEAAEMLAGKGSVKMHKARLERWHQVFGMVMSYPHLFLEALPVTQEQADIKKKQEQMKRKKKTNLTGRLESSLVDVC
jgi:hypothetical protein